jgi:hypothetical protein
MINHSQFTLKKLLKSVNLSVFLYFSYFNKYFLKGKKKKKKVVTNRDLFGAKTTNFCLGSHIIWKNN